MRERYVVVDLDCDGEFICFLIDRDNNGKGYRGPREAAFNHDRFYNALKKSATRRKTCDRPIGYCNCTIALVRMAEKAGSRK